MVPSDILRWTIRSISLSGSQVLGGCGSHLEMNGMGAPNSAWKVAASASQAIADTLLVLHGLIMSKPTPRGHVAAAVGLLLIVNLFILMAMVVAPSDSRVMELSNSYKLINLSLGAGALAITVWRNWYVLLTLFAILQVVGFFLFANYLRSLPM